VVNAKVYCGGGGGGGGFLLDCFLARLLLRVEPSLIWWCFCCCCARFNLSPVRFNLSPVRFNLCPLLQSLFSLLLSLCPLHASISASIAARFNRCFWLFKLRLLYPLCGSLFHFLSLDAMYTERGRRLGLLTKMRRRCAAQLDDLVSAQAMDTATTRSSERGPLPPSRLRYF
jgi:hypothetical protein